MTKENLRKFSDMSKEEHRKLSRKGGINSGKSKRKKANLRKAFEVILQADVQSEQMKEHLTAMGFENSNEMALAMVMFSKALKGNVKAFEQIIKLVGVKDDFDIEEQKSKIDYIKMSTKEKESKIQSEDTVENKLQNILDIIEKEYKDE